MMKNKFCLVIIIIFIDSLWAGKIKKLNCPEHEFFNEKGKACEPTCKSVIHPELCTEEIIRACECEIGYVRNDTDICILPLECPNILPEIETTSLRPEPNSTEKVITEIYTLENSSLNDQPIQDTGEIQLGNDKDFILRGFKKIFKNILAKLSGGNKVQNTTQSKRSINNYHEYEALLKESFEQFGTSFVYKTDFSEKNESDDGNSL